jgi:hypothetical protein
VIKTNASIWFSKTCKVEHTSRNISVMKMTHSIKMYKYDFVQFLFPANCSTCFEWYSSPFIRSTSKMHLQHLAQFEPYANFCCRGGVTSARCTEPSTRNKTKFWVWWFAKRCEQLLHFLGSYDLTLYVQLIFPRRFGWNCLLYLQGFMDPHDSNIKKMHCILSKVWETLIKVRPHAIREEPTTALFKLRPGTHYPHVTWYYECMWADQSSTSDYVT